MTNYLTKNHKGFSPVILILVLGLGILVLSGIIFLKNFNFKNPADEPIPSPQLALLSPSPLIVDPSDNEEDDIGGEEGDSVTTADLEGPD